MLCYAQQTACNRLLCQPDQEATPGTRQVHEGAAQPPANFGLLLKQKGLSAAPQLQCCAALPNGPHTAPESLALRTSEPETASRKLLSSARMPRERGLLILVAVLLGRQQLAVPYNL